MATIQYRYNCATQGGALVNETRAEAAGAPTVCVNDGGVISNITIIGSNVDMLDYVRVCDGLQILDVSRNYWYTIAPSTLAAGVSLTLPVFSSNDTFAFTNLSQTLSNKSLVSCVAADGGDATKRIAFQSSGATTGTTLTLASNQSTSQTLSVPNITSSDTVVTTGSTQTITGAKTLMNIPFRFTGSSTYSVGTASQSGTTITGQGASFNVPGSALNGGVIIWADGSYAIINYYLSINQTLWTTQSQTVTAQAYTIYYGGLQEDSAGNVGLNSLRIGGLTNSLPLSVDSVSKRVVSAALDLTQTSITTGALPISRGGTGNAAGTPTFTSMTLSATTNQLTLGGAANTTISATAPSSSRVYTLHDCGGNANFAMSTGGALTVTNAPVAGYELVGASGTTASWQVKSLPINGLIDATGTTTVNNGNYGVVLRWQLTTATNNGLYLLESAASTATDSSLLYINTLSGSTASPLIVSKNNQAMIECRSNGETYVRGAGGPVWIHGAQHAAYVYGGTNTTTSAGSAAHLFGGSGGSTSGDGGLAWVQGGTPTSGNGGSVQISGADGVGTNKNGGNVNIYTGAATGSGTAGSVQITTTMPIKVNTASGNTGDVLTSNGAAAAPTWSPVTITPPACTEVSATSSTNITSASYGLLNAMTITPAAGNYLVMFSSYVSFSGTGITASYAIHVGGTIQTVSERTALVNNTGIRYVVATQCKVTVNGSQAIEIQAKTTSGTITYYNRTLDIIRCT